MFRCPASSAARRAITKPTSRRNSASPIPAPALQPARRCLPPTTNGCARSAPSKSCLAASAFPARSARPRSAPPTRACRPDSSKAGSFWRAFGPGERTSIAAYWPRSGQNRQSRWQRQLSSCGGHPRSLKRETGERPMNATIRSEKLESTEVDSNLAAVSEVEAGIRDFVRNDIAYLRRPPGVLNTDEPALEPSAEATVTNVNSLIQRVAGTSLAEIEKLI